MLEVKSRCQKINNMDKETLHHWLKKRTVPVVIGPGKLLWMLDRHHSMRAMLDSKVKDKKVQIKIKDNLSHLSTENFWKVMQARNWIYLYKCGEGPFSVDSLPKVVSGLEEDPFRSLAWAVKDRKVFTKGGLFCEFIWAEFFRKWISKDLVEGEKMWAVVDYAIALSVTSPEAKLLPGYRGATTFKSTSVSPTSKQSV